MPSQEFSSLLASIKLSVGCSERPLDCSIATEREWQGATDLFRAVRRGAERRLRANHTAARCCICGPRFSAVDEPALVEEFSCMRPARSRPMTPHYSNNLRQHQTPLKRPQRHCWFAAFFAFGATMCLLTIVLLVFPGTKLDSLWNLNPDARVAFQSLGSWSILLMLAVGIGCALTAIGLWRGTLWGIRLGLAMLVVNIIGDLVNVITRHDYRSLIGLVIAGVMIFYLARSAPRRRTH
jgi:hypothetical protein